MKKLIILFLILFFCPLYANAANLGSQLSGRIVLNVEKNGEAWYINPVNLKRYYLGRPADAFRVMRELGLGINEVDFQGLAQEGTTVSGDVGLAKRLSGRIVIRTEVNGEAWYINPVNLKRYYLGRPADAFRVMRELGLGISRENLALIHKPEMSESLDQYSKYERQTITTAKGSFKIDLIEIDLSDPNLKIITDTADSDNCKSNCQAKPLARFITENNAFAGINATYFCDSSGCVKNYYFYPVYNSGSGKMINEDQLKYWTTGPIMAFDINNKFYYFKDSREFKGVADFEKTYGVKLQAAIGNKPRLIENKMNLLLEWDIDDKQKTAKSSRNAIAYKNNKLYLVISYQTTVPDLADIMQAMEMEYALNLDGGYSSALFYNDEYMVGPGRNIPNVILFSKK